MSKRADFDDYSATLVSTRIIGDDVCWMELECSEIAASAEPGQFVLLRDPKWGRDPLLMRPFAVAGVNGNNVEVLFRILPRGKGTRRLSEVSVGEKLVLRGPMGRGFDKPEINPVYLAGALGIAPLLFAMQRFGNGVSILGVPGRGWEDFTDWVLSRYPDTMIYSDDGSIGNHGNALDGLFSLDYANCHVMACGPNGMLAALTGRGLSSCQVSLEKRMACGMGACCGCVVNTVAGKKRACVDGPVFDLEEVIWND